MRINVASIVALAAVCGASCIPVPAQASPYGTSVRQELLQTRQTVKQAVQGGQVDRFAGRRLAQKVNSIQRQVTFDRQFGRLSAQERLQVVAELERVNYDLLQAEHQSQR